MNKIRVGIVGLGAITQLVYLSDLDMLRDRYEITALCGVSPGVLNIIGEKHPKAVMCSSTDRLAALDCVDAVIIANSDEFHYVDAMCLIQHGKHIFIEKPMCFNMREAKDIKSAAEKHGVKAMVGYVRRFSDVYHIAKKELESIRDNINYVRIRDILGYNFLFMNENSGVFRFDDIPDSVADMRNKLLRESLPEALGEYHADKAGLYMFMTGLCCHDFSAMRGLLGMPESVESAVSSKTGNYLSVIFNYKGFSAAYEAGIDSQKRRESTVEVFTENKTVKIEYGCFYYLKQMPDAVQIDECVDGVFSQRRVVPTYRNPYARELEAFYEAISSGAAVASPPEDYMEDLKLFAMILEKVKKL